MYETADAGLVAKGPIRKQGVIFSELDRLHTLLSQLESKTEELNPVLLLETPSCDQEKQQQPLYSDVAERISAASSRVSYLLARLSNHQL